MEKVAVNVLLLEDRSSVEEIVIDLDQDDDELPDGRFVEGESVHDGECKIVLEKLGTPSDSDCEGAEVSVSVSLEQGKKAVPYGKDEAKASLPDNRLHFTRNDESATPAAKFSDRLGVRKVLKAASRSEQLQC